MKGLAGKHRVVFASRRMSLPTTALLADDEAHLRVFIRLILQELGIVTIHEARNGREAVEIYRQHQPELVMLDINMPEMTGMEALEEIMQINPDALVVMLTGHASRQIVEASAKQGASHYIRKDTPRSEITSLLKELFAEIYGE